MKRTLEQRISILEKKLDLNESLIPDMPEKQSLKFSEQDIEFAALFMKKINSKYPSEYNSSDNSWYDDKQIRIRVYETPYSRDACTNIQILNKKMFVNFFSCSVHWTRAKELASALTSILGKPVSYMESRTYGKYSFNIRSKIRVKVEGGSQEITGVEISYQKLLRVLGLLKEASHLANKGFADWYGNKKPGSGTID